MLSPRLLNRLGPRAFLFVLPAGAAASAAAQGVPYSTSASWTSYTTGVATGGAFVDLDHDGYLDLVVANGNDILRQKVEVYTNNGAGSYPTNPQWSSTDVDYHGHLAVGDVDQDGWDDVAVSVFLGPGGFGDKGRVKLYRNVGGTLSSTPTWSSSDRSFTFSCDLGDADGDGDLDLAVATGEPYFDPPDVNRVYFNAAGTLATSPGWTSAAADHALDVSFGDSDGDGDLDLAFATAKGPARVFRQGPGGIETSPSWSATDNLNQNGNTIVWKDVDGDGWQELAVSDNDQLTGGSGLFKLYDNVGGVLATTPSWSHFGGQVSAVAFGDVDLDGWPELAGGIWFGGTRIYDNAAGSLALLPSWSSSVAGTVEALFFGDVDRNGLVDAQNEAQAANGGRVFYLDHAPVHEILAVRADGLPLSAGDWSADMEDGWIALDRTPLVGISVNYRWSQSLDLGITNWDQNVGNQVHRRPIHPQVVQRNGSGVNTIPLSSLTLPFLNSTWAAQVDCSGHAPSFAVLVGQSGPSSGVVIAAGEVLIDLVHGVSYFMLPSAHAGGPASFASLVPNNASLLGIVVYCQAGCLGAPGLRFSNALDARIGR